MSDVRDPDRWSLLLAERESLLRVARGRCTCPQDAEDLVQEALLRAACLPCLAPETVGGLLRTMVINLATDQHRRAVTRGRFLSRLGADERTAVPLDEPACDEAEARWLHGLSRTLPESDREVLLHRAAGHSVATTANRLGLTYKAAESAYTRARRQLRLAWKATLGVLVGAFAGLRGVARSGSGGGAVALSAVAVAVILASVRVPAPPSAAVQVAPRDSAPRTVDSPVNRGMQAQDGDDRADVSRRVERATSSSVEPRARDFYTGPVGDRRLVRTGVGTGTTDEDESLGETLQRCLDKGIDVSVTVVGCRH